MPYLLDRFPGLDLPHLPLGQTPTPVRRIDDEPSLGLTGEVWLKDEGVFGDGPWGGNKVRKLEWILPEAQRRGVRALLSVGGIGTHWGLALARYAEPLGLRTILGLVDQPVDGHVRDQLARLYASQAEIHRFTTPARLRLAAPYLMARGVAASGGRRLPWYLPAGGSNAVGALGYVETALEIAAQVEAGELPEPGTVVVPVGSGGTASGLALGLRLAGLRSRVLGVVVNDSLPLDGPALAGLADACLGHLRSRGLRVPLLPITPVDLDVRADWLGATYGDPTPASVAAVRDAAGAGLVLEPVYTGKALAALRDLGGELPGPVLWLQTHGPR